MTRAHVRRPAGGARSAGAPRVRAEGFTLVELMVAMVLGLLVIGAVISVFLGTQSSSRTLDAMSRVQETGRLGLERVARDVREAGYRACRDGELRNLLDTTGLDYDPALHDVRLAFGNQPAAGDLADHVAGHTFRLQRMVRVDGGPYVADAESTPAVDVSPTPPLDQGDIVVIADPEGRCEMFQNVPAQQGTLNRSPGQNVTPGNIGPAGQVEYMEFDGPVELLEVASVTYFVGESAHSDGVRALFRQVGDGPPREVVDGVYDMRVDFGRDVNGDLNVDAFAAADATTGWGEDEWRQVVAVRLHLLAYNGEEDRVLDEPRQGLPFGGAVFDAPDRRLYQVFTTTVAVRNRVP